MDLIRGRARGLRKNPTKAEKLLWSHLRFWQVVGYKFRRQQPLGKYIVDFVCLEKKLIIELDGGQHAEQVEYDSTRDGWLGAHGFRIIRFWNNDVLENSDGVKQKILTALQGTPFLNPSPQGGRRPIRRKNPVR